MLTNVGLYSYLTAFITYAVLTILLVSATRGRPLGAVLVISSSLTMLWAGVVAAGTVMAYPPVALMQLTELLRNASWIFFLLQLTSLRFDSQTSSLGGRRWLTWFILGLVDESGAECFECVKLAVLDVEVGDDGAAGILGCHD